MRLKSLIRHTTYAAAILASGSAIAQTLNVETPTPSEQTTGDSIKGTTYGLWNVVCVEDQKCVASTSLAKKNEQGQSRKVVEVRIERVADKRTIYVQLPSGVLIKPGVSIRLGEASISLDYIMCATSYCLAAAEMTDESIDLMRKAPDMKVILVMAPNQKTKVPTKGSFDFSLEGSGAALDDIKQ